MNTTITLIKDIVDSEIRINRIPNCFNNLEGEYVSMWLETIYNSNIHLNDIRCEFESMKDIFRTVDVALMVNLWLNDWLLDELSTSEFMEITEGLKLDVLDLSLDNTPL